MITKAKLIFLQQANGTIRGCYAYTTKRVIGIQSVFKVDREFIPTNESKRLDVYIPSWNIAEQPGVFHNENFVTDDNIDSIPEDVKNLLELNPYDFSGYLESRTPTKVEFLLASLKKPILGNCISYLFGMALFSTNNSFTNLYLPKKKEKVEEIKLNLPIWLKYTTEPCIASINHAQGFKKIVIVKGFKLNIFIKGQRKYVFFMCKGKAWKESLKNYGLTARKLADYLDDETYYHCGSGYCEIAGKLATEGSCITPNHRAIPIETYMCTHFIQRLAHDGLLPSDSGVTITNNFGDKRKMVEAWRGERLGNLRKERSVL